MIPLASVRHACRTLAPAEIRAIFQLILQYEHVPTDDQPITAGESLLLWVADLLEGLKLCSRDQQLILLKRLHPGLSRHANTLWGVLQDGSTEESCADLHLGIADRSYVTSEAWVGYFDMQSGQTVPALPNLPLETIVYNLSVLFMTHHETCRQFEAKDQNGSAERAVTESSSCGRKSAADG